MYSLFPFFLFLAVFFRVEQFTSADRVEQFTPADREEQFTPVDAISYSMHIAQVGASRDP